MTKLVQLLVKVFRALTGTKVLFVCSTRGDVPDLPSLPLRYNYHLNAMRSCCHGTQPGYYFIE